MNISRLNLLPIALSLTAGLFLTSCKDKASHADPEKGAKSEQRPSSRGGTIGNPERKPASAGHARAANDEDFTRDLLKEARVESLDWEAALRDAMSRYRGPDLDRFIDAYAGANAGRKGFDRVGFLGKIRELRGPGSKMTALLTQTYSGKMGATLSEVLTELHQLGLDRSESLLIASSMVTGPVVTQATVQDLVAAVARSEEPSMKSALQAAMEEKISAEMKGKSPGEIAGYLKQLSPEKALDSGAVIERAVNESESEWWTSFQKTCRGEDPPEAGLIRQNGRRMVAPLLASEGGANLLAELSQNSASEFAGSMSTEVAKQWISSDAGEVAAWANTQPKGPIKDRVVFELVKDLHKRGLADESVNWMREIEDATMRSTLNDLLTPAGARKANSRHSSDPVLK